MLRCSMVRCPEGEEEGETAFIDQRAVAAGKNIFSISLHVSRNSIRSEPRFSKSDW